MKKKILLITGGTGSFGKAVTKLSTEKKLFDEIRIFSRDEKKQDEMRREYNSAKLNFFIGDIRDPGSLEIPMAGVDYIFHAAALKQVPSCEFFPIEAVKTNVIGTDNLIKKAKNSGVKKIVVLSTDKAAYPINAMGMSKALMEKVAIAHAVDAEKQGLVISCTRYGNVMASRGSVIPKFLDQIKSKSDITVTNPDMTRFMMTLEDAVNLVLFAFKRARSGDIFVQKSPATNLNTLANAMKKHLKCSNKIKIIGTRHGEKLYETLLTREESLRAEDLGKYYRVKADSRGMNYEQFFSKGNTKIDDAVEYHSHNTHQLDENEVIKLLQKIGVKKNKLHI